MRSRPWRTPAPTCRAVNIPPERVDDLAAKRIPDPGLEVVVYCAGPTCDSSVDVAERLVALGYTNVRHYSGGKQGGARQGFRSRAAASSGGRSASGRSRWGRRRSSGRCAARPGRAGSRRRR